MNLYKNVLMNIFFNIFLYFQKTLSLQDKIYDSINHEDHIVLFMEVDDVNIFMYENLPRNC